MARHCILRSQTEQTPEQKQREAYMASDVRHGRASVSCLCGVKLFASAGSGRTNMRTRADLEKALWRMSSRRRVLTAEQKLHATRHIEKRHPAAIIWRSSICQICFLKGIAALRPLRCRRCMSVAWRHRSSRHHQRGRQRGLLPYSEEAGHVGGNYR